MNNIHLSVCIPAYNRVEVLGELLDSVVAQDYEHYEEIGRAHV